MHTQTAPQSIDEFNEAYADTSFATAIFEEVTGEITEELLSNGDMEDHPMLVIARAHGPGFLVGTAAALIDASTFEESAGERETLYLSAITHLLHAVMIEREQSAADLNDAMAEAEAAIHNMLTGGR